MRSAGRTARRRKVVRQGLNGDCWPTFMHLCGGCFNVRKTSRRVLAVDAHATRVVFALHRRAGKLAVSRQMLRCCNTLERWNCALFQGRQILGLRSNIREGGYRQLFSLPEADADVIGASWRVA